MENRSSSGGLMAIAESFNKAVAQRLELGNYKRGLYSESVEFDYKDRSKILMLVTTNLIKILPLLQYKTCSYPVVFDCCA